LYSVITVLLHCTRDSTKHSPYDQEGSRRPVVRFQVGMNPIIPVVRREPFDDPGWAFELKLDGFRCIADTLDGRLPSKQQNRMKRFESLLEALPQGYVFDGEIVCLDEESRSSTTCSSAGASRSTLLLTC